MPSGRRDEDGANVLFCAFSEPSWRNISLISARRLVHLFQCGGEFSRLVCVWSPCHVCAVVSCASRLFVPACRRSGRQAPGPGAALVRSLVGVFPAASRLLAVARAMLEVLPRPGWREWLGDPQAVGMSVGNRFQRHYRRAVRPIRDRVLRRLPAVGDPVLASSVGARVAVLFCLAVWLSVHPRRVVPVVWRGRPLVARGGLDRPCGPPAWGPAVRRLEALWADLHCVR